MRALPDGARVQTPHPELIGTDLLGVIGQHGPQRASDPASSTATTAVHAPWRLVNRSNSIM